MALDVKICNTFNVNDVTKVCYKVNSTGKKCLNPGDCNRDPIILAQQDCLKITAEVDNQEEEFQIGLKVTNGYPKVNIQRFDRMWTLTNIGNNTGAQVGAGPDGQ